MSRTDLLCLNRIIKPQIPLEEFLKFTADLGIKFVEVCNDFTDKGILDGLSDAALKKAFKENGIKALTINALYPFEDVKILKENIEKLKGHCSCPSLHDDSGTRCGFGKDFAERLGQHRVPSDFETASKFVLGRTTH